LTNPTQLNLTESHKDITSALTQLESGKPVILHQDGKEVAALISIEDLHLLERLIEEEEDRIDLAESKKILAEVKEQGTVSWEDVKAEAGF
jgi:PHD/YefM family antitoxin component YafN of YafNO toxin-antitoxin module